MSKKQTRLTDFEKGRIFQTNSDGRSTSRIISELGKSRSTINTFIARIRAGGSLERVESTRRKRKTTTREDNLIVRQVLKSRRASCPSIREDFGLQKVTTRTIQRRIKVSGQFVPRGPRRRLSWVPQTAPFVSSGAKLACTGLPINGAVFCTRMSRHLFSATIAERDVIDAKTTRARSTIPS